MLQLYSETQNETTTYELQIKREPDAAYFVRLPCYVWSDPVVCNGHSASCWRLIIALRAPSATPLGVLWQKIKS